MTAQERKKYYEHPDRPGAGAEKRRGVHGKAKIGIVMGEYKRGTLRSGSGDKVTNPKQAVAIAMSESGMSKKKAHKKKIPVMVNGIG